MGGLGNRTGQAAVFGWMYQFTATFQFFFLSLPLSVSFFPSPLHHWVSIHLLSDNPACPSQRLIRPVRDYLLPMWYGTVLRIWPQQDSWMRPLVERGWGGGRLCHRQHHIPHLRPQKPQQPPSFKTIRFTLNFGSERAGDTGGPGGCTDNLKSIQIHFLWLLALHKAWQPKHGCRGWGYGGKERGEWEAVEVCVLNVMSSVRS